MQNRALRETLVGEEGAVAEEHRGRAARLLNPVKKIGHVFEVWLQGLAREARIFSF